MARRWLIGTALAGCLVAGGLAVAVYRFDPNTLKGRIEAAVHRATGRTLTLAGPIHVAWGLTPGLEAEDVSLSNRPGGSRPLMVKVARAEARLRLVPLLAGRVEIASVTLVRPDLLLETDAAGQANWQFQRPPAPGASPAAGSAPTARSRPLVDAVQVESGRLTWHDGQTGRTLSADVPHATLTAGDGPVHLQAQAEFANTAATIDATLGTVDQLTAAQPGPMPVTVAAQLGDATFALQGEADPVAHTLAGQVHALVPSLARTAALLGRTGVPPLQDVGVEATLRPGAWPEAYTLHAGASDLGGLLPGLSLAQLSYAGTPGQPARLAASGALGGMPWQVAGGVVPGANAVSLRGVSLTSAAGNLAGDVAVAWAPRPALRGTLIASRLDLDALHGLFRPAAQPASPQPVPAQPVPASPAAGGPAPVATPRRVVPDTPLPWAALARADADLALSAGTLRVGGADYHAATARLALSGGTLRLDPVSVQAPEGRVDASFSADAGSQAAVLNLRAAAVALDPLLRAFGLPGGSSGSVEIDLSLHGAGPTPHAIAATLDGHAGLAMVDGELSNAALAAALGDVLRRAGTRLDPGGTSHLRCLAIRADARNGQVSFPAMVLDSSRLSLEGRGSVDLGSETLALHVRPVLRLGGGSGLSVPLLVAGALGHPSTTLDPAFGGNRVGVTIGGPAEPDRCGPALTAARDGRAGRMPGPAPAGKPMKPADLLRSLLR